MGNKAMLSDNSECIGGWKPDTFAMQRMGDETQQPDLAASNPAPIQECGETVGRLHRESSSGISTNTDSTVVHAELDGISSKTGDAVTCNEAAAAAEEPSRVPVSFVGKETVAGLPRSIHCWVPSAESELPETNEQFVWTQQSGASSVRENQNKRPRDDKTRVGRDEVVKKACEPCRRSKIKCSNEIPCSRCISRNIEYSCVPCGNPGKVKVDRPVSVPGGDGATMEPTAYMPLNEFCWCRRDLDQFLKGLPPVLQSQLIKVMETKSREAKASSQAYSIPFRPGNDCSEFQTANLMEHDLWSGHPSIGVLQADYDPHTGAVSSVFANQRFSSMVGLQRNEFLNHIKSCSLPISIPHVDLAFLIFEDLERPNDLFTSSVFSLEPAGRDGLIFIKEQKQRVYDSNGRLSRITHFWESIGSALFRSLRDVSTNSKLELLRRPRSKKRKGSATQHSVGCIGKTVAQLKATGNEEDVARVELLEDYATYVYNTKIASMSMGDGGNHQWQQSSVQLQRMMGLDSNSSIGSVPFLVGRAASGGWQPPQQQQPQHQLQQQQMQQHQQQHQQQLQQQQQLQDDVTKHVQNVPKCQPAPDGLNVDKVRMIGLNPAVVDKPLGFSQKMPKSVANNQKMAYDIHADGSQQPKASQNLSSAQPMAIPLLYGPTAAGMMQIGQDQQQQQLLGVNTLWMPTMQQGGIRSGVLPSGGAVINPSIPIEDMQSNLEMQKKMGTGMGNQQYVNFNMGGIQLHQQQLQQ